MAFEIYRQTRFGGTLLWVAGKRAPKHEHSVLMMLAGNTPLHPQPTFFERIARNLAKV